MQSYVASVSISLLGAKSGRAQAPLSRKIKTTSEQNKKGYKLKRSYAAILDYEYRWQGFEYTVSRSSRVRKYNRPVPNSVRCAVLFNVVELYTITNTINT